VIFKWLRDLFRDARPYVTQAEARTLLKAVMAESTPPRYVYDQPERDEAKEACVHLHSDNDILALQLQREQAQKDSPRIVKMPVRGQVR
jgi:hypothetical protein